MYLIDETFVMDGGSCTVQLHKGLVTPADNKCLERLFGRHVLFGGSDLWVCRVNTST
jgi:hypothetical protein